MCENEVPKGGPKRAKNVKKLIFGCPGGGANKKHRKIDENVIVSGRESSDSTWGFLVYSENRPFQKSVPRSTSKDLQNRAHFGPEFRKCLKKGGHEKGSKTGAPKSYFLGPKRPLGAVFENAKSIISPRVRSGLAKGGNKEATGRVKSALGPPQRIKDP